MRRGWDGAAKGTAVTSLTSRYRELPALAGAAFLPIGFLARLPNSMIQFGTVLMVTTVSGSLAFAGVTAGALALGMAAGGPVIGWLADHRGQRPVMVAASLLNAVLICVLVLEVTAAAPPWLTLATAAAVGASTPQIGALIRSRWIVLTGGDRRLSTAMSYEGAADEVTYILGPAVVSVLALISPRLSLFGAAALVAVFGTWVGLHHTARSARLPRPTDRGPTVWRDPMIVGLLVISATIGVFFGGAQTGVTAVATAAGAAASAGLLYSVMAVGSTITGIASTALPARFPLRDRLVVFIGWLTLAVIPLVFVTSVPVVAVVLLIVGAAVGPAFITMYSLAGNRVSSDRTGVTMTLISASGIVGVAIGSALGGRLAQSSGSGAAFVVSVSAIAIGTVVAFGVRRTR